MNSIKIINITTTIAILFFSAATQCFSADTPKEVVASFCKLDFEGSRLSSETFSKIGPLIMYPAEPGWDTVLGVHGYKITNEKIEGDTAKVIVRYEIDRSWPDKIDEIGQYQEETFFLNKEEGNWKITKYIMYPRVSSEFLCAKYKFCLTGS